MHCAEVPEDYYSWISINTLSFLPIAQCPTDWATITPDLERDIDRDLEGDSNS